jgi:hypothetical protein
MTYSSASPHDRLLNSELERIVLALGGTIYSHDKVALLQAWLDRLNIMRGY